MKKPNIVLLLITLSLFILLAAPSLNTLWHTEGVIDNQTGGAIVAVVSPSPTYQSSPSYSPSPTYYPSYSSSASPSPSVSPSPTYLYSPSSTVTDITPPSQPQNLTIADVRYVSMRELLLDWDEPSTDNVAVAGYNIYRDGILANRVSPLLPRGAEAATILPSFTGTYSYSISAYDAAGNESTRSNSILYRSYPVGTRLKLTADIKNRSGAVLFPKDALATSIYTHPFWYNSGITHYAVLFDDAHLNDQARALELCGTHYGECPGSMWSVYLEYQGSYSQYMLVASPYLTLAPPVDTTPPSVIVVSPLPGALITGITALSALATDNMGIAGVQFFVDSTPVAAEDTTTPYSLVWDTASIANGTHSVRAIARDTSNNVTVSPAITFTTSNLSPANKPWQNFNLQTWKIQLTAKSGTTDYFLKNIGSNSGDATAVAPWFFTNPDGSMAFWLDAAKTNDGTWYRTELREVMDGVSNGTNWSALIGTSTLRATMKIPYTPTYNAATKQITIVQIHPSSGDPLMRLVWYAVPNAGRNLKVHYKTDAAGFVNASEFCPNTNIQIGVPFAIETIVDNGKLTVKVNGQFCLNNFAINPGWTHENYFKAGNYASQSYGGVGQVDIHSLDVTHSVPGI
jgi:hypothetical protein